MNIVEHYNMLIDENNDPVYDTEPLKKYMDKWDGQVFIDTMKLDKTKTVLEIGVGTGRLALKTIPHCKEFVGIDLSQKTIERAAHNLSHYRNAERICSDFMTYDIRLYRNRICIHSSWFEVIEKADRFVFGIYQL